MSQHNLHVETQTQSRPRISGCDMGTSSHDQTLSRHEIPCHDNEPFYNYQPLSQHKTVCHNIELFSLDDLLSKSVATKFPCRVRAQGLLCVPGLVCHDIKILYRDINSPYSGQLYRDIELLYRDIISPCLSQLCRDIKMPSFERKSS